MLLFDIDLTLIATGGAGREALDETFERLFGWPGAFAHYPFSGRVDPGIVRDVYARCTGGQPLPAEREAQVFEVYLGLLERNLARGDDYQVLPGVRQLLDFVSQNPSFGLGLATGNIERGARLKLAPGDLNRYFASGGFGSDAAERAELVRIAIARCAPAAAAGASRQRVYVFGDTPYDVRAAHAAGAAAVAVASGEHDLATLRAEHPEILLSDLRPPWPWLDQLA